MSEKEKDKEKLTKILQEKLLKINHSAKDAEAKFSAHVGFKKEKENFTDYVLLYVETGGNFRPNKEIICYVGAPGTGKTSFIETLGKATGRELWLVPCAGLGQTGKYSILGDENKPSLVAQAMLESECKNPIISFDELEKVKDQQIQQDLIKLFEIYKKGEKLFDKYYQKEIELDHISFFATVNYSDKLAPLLKNNVEMRELEDYNETERIAILKLKKAKIEKIYGLPNNAINDQDIKFLVRHIYEGGVRKSEQALDKMATEIIYAQQQGKTPFNGNKKQWIKTNILPYQESFRSSSKHYFLYFLWGIAWILLLTIIIKKLILSKGSEKLTKNE